MKVRLLRGIAAVALTITVVLSGSVPPAQASSDPDGPNTSLIDMIDLALSLVGRAGSGGVTPEALVAMTQDVINALNQAESAVITHIDAIAAAEVRGDAQHAVIEFDDINSFADETLEDWAIDVTGAATRAAAYLGAVSDPRAVDDIGYAVVTLYPIALVARARAGFGTTKLMADYRIALQKIVDKLAPSCRYHFPEPNAVPTIRAYTCTVYGQHSMTQLEQNWFGVWQLGPIDPAAVEFGSYANTSRRVAIEVLGTLP